MSLLLAGLMQRLCRQWLSRHPQRIGPLKRIAGQSICLELSHPTLALLLTCDGQVIKVTPVDDGAVDIRLKGRGPDLLKILHGEAVPESFQIIGDTRALKAWLHVFALFWHDFGDDLTALPGPVGGAVLTRIGQGLRAYTEHELADLYADVGDYMTFEQAHFVKNQDLAEHAQRLDFLRRKIQSVEAKIPVLNHQ